MEITEANRVFTRAENPVAVTRGVDRDVHKGGS